MLWSIVGSIAGFVLILLGTAVVTFAVIFATGQFPTDPSSAEVDILEAIKSYPVLASSVVAQATLMSLIPFLVAWAVKARPKEALGLRGAPVSVYVATVVGIVALGPTSDALAQLASKIFEPSEASTLELLNGIVHSQPYWMLWPLIALAPGISEELFFRGLIQRSYGFGAKAITISAITFSLVHMDPIHVTGVIPLGFFLAWVAVRSGSTLVTIVAHIANNSLALLAGQMADPNAPEEHLPLWVMPIGWLIAGACAYVIWKQTSDRKAFVGPCGEPGADEIEKAPAVIRDFRVLRREGVLEQVVLYVRDASLQDGMWIGRFQPGELFGEIALGENGLLPAGFVVEGEDFSGVAPVYVNLEKSMACIAMEAEPRPF